MTRRLWQPRRLSAVFADLGEPVGQPFEAPTKTAALAEAAKRHGPHLGVELVTRRVDNPPQLEQR